MRERILEWLRQEHRDPHLRTIRGIAAMLNAEENDVCLALAQLEREGKIRGRREKGKEIWFPTVDPPQGL